jgi:hypothetical protein
MILHDRKLKTQSRSANQRHSFDLYVNKLAGGEFEGVRGAPGEAQTAFWSGERFIRYGQSGLRAKTDIQRRTTQR